VATSLASKLFTIGIQVLAMPLAIHALGPKSFALYAMLSSALMWLSLANIGMGPRVAIEIADAEVHGDQARQSRLVTGAVVPISALIVLLFLLLIVAKVIGIENVFGENYQDQASVISTRLLLLALSRHAGLFR
jgi:O-antigen/teichoic acid export membrane protein